MPHSVDSTATLVDASLHNNAQISQFAVRSVYSAAVAKFVTGAADLGQASVVKRSMYLIAETTGMPVTWVELRHEITHGQTPDLRSLERCVEEALSWLWERFWSKLGGLREGVVTNVVTDAELRLELSNQLKTFRRDRRDDLRSGQIEGVESVAAEVAAKATASWLLKLCDNRNDGITTLVKLLLEEKMLLPSDKR